MLQGNLFMPKTSWAPPAVSSLPAFLGARRVAVDVETHDPKLKELGPGVRRGGYMVGVAVAIEDGPSFYLPFAHQGGDNLDQEKVLRYLKDNFTLFKGVLVGTNLSYDLDYMMEAGIGFPKVSWFRDVQIAEGLIDELQQRYGLDAIAQRYGLAGKDTDDLDEAVKGYSLKGSTASNIWRLPARHVAAYAQRDVTLPLELLRRQERVIEEQSLGTIWDLESRVMPVLLRMRRRGVRFSHDRLDAVDAWSQREEQKALDVVYKETGVRIPLGEVWGATNFASALDAIGVKCPFGDNGKPSVDADWLKSVKHPATDAMLRARRVNKVRTTFVQSIRDYGVNGRIHCGMNQLKREKEDGDTGGAAFGRLSSEHPNMQQQPARDPEIGPMWRGLFLPEEGEQWACLDYSQQEPRLLTHYAALTECQGAAEAARMYRDDPKTDNHAMMAKLSGLPRSQAKEIYLGLCYGMGSAKLAHKLGLPTVWIYSKRQERMIEVAGDEGASVLERFNDRVPYVQQLSKKCEARARERGYLTTVLGRRCRFPQKADGTFDWTYKALNRLIQGSAADQTKAAMVAVDAAGLWIMLQVHDELDLSITAHEEAERAAKIMREVVALLVPSKVDIEVGPSWGELK